MVADQETPRLIELLAMLAHYHGDFRLGLGHTLGLGEPWLPNSNCDCLLLSKPYPFGSELEVCAINGTHAHFLWALPITNDERAFKVAEGVEALEQRFEDIGLQYWLATRPSAV
jgi:hypothetical protein